MPPAKGAKKTPTMPRNWEIAPGLSRFSRARMFHKRGMWLKLKKPFPAQAKKNVAAEKYVTKPIGGDKNGKERKVLATKEPKYRAQVQGTVKSTHRKSQKTPLRSTITPGTILILLTGPHRGKRVVFLKQLEKSGLLLVTGPLKLNSTPIRRVAQAFVIATKTHLSIDGVKIPDEINDDYFKAKKTDKSKSVGIFAGGEKQEYVVSDERKNHQKQIDASILAAISKHPEKKYLSGYLGSRFCIGKNQHPHNMVF